MIKLYAGDNEYYYARNHIYSTVALMDDEGDVLERYQYDAYGKPYFCEPNHVLLTNQESGYDNNILFGGYRFDPETGKYHARHRDLDDYTGRWFTPDPAGYVDGLNLYEYVRNNPFASSDPLGLMGPYMMGPNGESVLPPLNLATKLLGVLASRIYLPGSPIWNRAIRDKEYDFQDELGEMRANTILDKRVLQFYKSLVVKAKEIPGMQLYCKPWKTIPVNFSSPFSDKHVQAGGSWLADDGSFLVGGLLNGAHSVWAKGFIKAFCKKKSGKDRCWIKIADDMKVHWKWHDELDAHSYLELKKTGTWSLKPSNIPFTLLTLIEGYWDLFADKFADAEFFFNIHWEDSRDKTRVYPNIENK